MLYSYILVFSLTTTNILFVEAQNQAKKMVLNAVVDKLIVRMTNHMKESGLNIVTIPDVQFDENGVLISQGITAKGGTFSDLSTIKRDEDVYIAILGNTITVRLVVGIGSAVVHFDDFQAWYGSIVLADELSVYINKNSVEIEMTLTVYEDSFRVTLDTLRMKKFGDIILERRREGNLKNVSNSFLTWILSWFKDKMKYSMEKAMREAIEKELTKHKLI